MEKCDVCNRIIKKKYQLKGYALCSKHMHQLHKYNEFKDNIPRTNKDLNNYRVEYETNSAIFDVYNQKNEKIAEFIIDLEDLNKVKYHKWRIDTNNRVITGNCTKKRPRREITHILLDFDKNNEKTKILVIDHKDGNTLNNKKENLRICSQSENVCNKHYMSNNISGVIGVSWDNNRKRWSPEVRYKEIRIHLGRYKDFNEAVYVRFIAEQYLFKEYQNADNKENYKKYIDLVSKERKKELKNYVINKINTKLNFGN